MYVIKLKVRKINLYVGKWKEICFKSLQRKLFLRFAPFKLNMKLLYTIKIFEFTLTKNDHFGFICLRTEMVLVDHLHLYITWISLSRLREAGTDPAFHILSHVEGKREGVDWMGGGGFRQNCVNSLLKFIQKRNCRVQEILKLS